MKKDQIIQAIDDLLDDTSVPEAQIKLDLEDIQSRINGLLIKMHKKHGYTEKEIYDYFISNN